jgi:type VI secretion system secreted protein VgrG
MRVFGKYLAVFSAVLALSLAGTATAAATVNLGTAGNFAVLGASTVTNTGSSIVNGNLGLSPGTSITGFPPGAITGVTHNSDAVASNAQSDLNTAYNGAAGLACGTTLTGQDLGGLTLTPGVYCFSSSAQLTGVLTLNGQGNPGAVFIFQIGSAITTASNSSVTLIGSAQACNVFWQVGSSATLGTNTNFQGTIMALASITLNTGTVVTGGVMAHTGAVTMDANIVNMAVCASPTPTPSITPTTSPTATPRVTPTPTVSPTASPTPILIGGAVMGTGSNNPSLPNAGAGSGGNGGSPLGYVVPAVALIALVSLYIARRKRSSAEV